MRILKWVLGALALLILLPVLVVAGALAWVNTEGGREFLERQAAGFVPGLRIEGLRGPLPGHLGFARLGYADAEGEWVVLEDGRIDLDLWALTSGTFRVERLEAARVAVARLPAAGPEAPPTPPGETVLPSLPSLPVAVALDRLAIGRIELGAPVLGQSAVFSLTGDAKLESGGLLAALDLRRLDAEARAALKLALTPAADRLSARLTFDEAPGGLVAGFIPPPEGGWGEAPLHLAMTLDGPASGAALELRAGIGEAVGLQAAGTVRATPDGGFGATLRGEARAAPLLPADLRPLAMPLGFTLDTDLPANRRLALRDLSLTLPAGTVTATGGVDLGTEALDLRLVLALVESRKFGALLPAGLAWTGVAAEARVTGTIAAPAIDMTAQPQGLATGVAQADAVLGPAPTLALKAALPGPSLDAVVTGAEGRLAAKGTLAEPIALDLEASLPRLEVLGAGSEGALEARVHAAGKLADPDLTVSATSGRIAAAGRVLEGLNLQAQVATPASAPRGTAQPGGDARRDAGEPRLPRPARWRGGADRGGGGAARPRPADRERPAGPGGAALRRRCAAGGDRSGTARAAGRGRGPGRAAGRGGGPGAAGWGAGLRGEAGCAAAGLCGAGGQPGGDRRRHAAGAGLDAARQGDGGRPFGPRPGDGGEWRLAAGPRGAGGQGDGGDHPPDRPGAGAARRRRRGGGRRAGAGHRQGGRVQAAGRWGPERADMGLTIAALPLTLAQRFAPDLAPRGMLSGEVRATGPVAKPEIRGTLNGTGIGLGADWARGLPLLTLKAEGSMVGDATQARAEVGAGPAGSITATARLPSAFAPGGFGPNGALAATLDGTLNLAPLAGPFLAAGADRATGRLALALRADGTIGAPRFGGRATLTGGEYRNASTGVRLSDIGGVLTGDGTRLVIERLEGKTTGGGTIGVTGSVDAGATGFPADLAIRARNARPVASELGDGDHRRRPDGARAADRRRGDRRRGADRAGGDPGADHHPGQRADPDQCAGTRADAAGHGAAAAGGGQSAAAGAAADP